MATAGFCRDLLKEHDAIGLSIKTMRLVKMQVRFSLDVPCEDLSHGLIPSV